MHALNPESRGVTLWETGYVIGVFYTNFQYSFCPVDKCCQSLQVVERSTFTG